MILDIEVTLVVHRQILRTVIQDRHVGIPFNIVDLRVFCHEVINNREDKVLHFGIRHVEHHLCASSA